MIKKNVSKYVLPFIFAFGTGCGVLTNNIHRVGKHPDIYRSAQLDEEDLEELLIDKNISVVVNLRGKKIYKKWYKDELYVCNKLGVKHYDVRISARRAPHKHELLQLTEVLENAKKNNHSVLIHCKAGADRSSLGSAVAGLIIYDRTVEEAMNEFCLWYGHVCFWKHLESVLEKYALFENRMGFSEWVRKQYGD